MKKDARKLTTHFIAVLKNPEFGRLLNKAYWDRLKEEQPELYEKYQNDFNKRLERFKQELEED